ncbi:hypothetical protein QX776_04285 [Alteromonadaceae bacterium BrNp21-10]|nr:hypothetical protein [Alteromonadaceae bacterium BrNp21-10]
MLKNILVKISLVIMLMGAIPLQAQAIDKMNAADLQAVCKAFDSKKESSTVSTNKLLCAMYIKGFLSGEDLYRSDKIPATTFRQQALQSRAGGLSEKYQMSENSSYCIPESISIEDIALLINRQKPASNVLAKNLLEKVLQQNFLCSK